MEINDEVPAMRVAVIGDKEWLKQRRHDDSMTDRNIMHFMFLIAAIYRHTDICQLIIYVKVVVDNRV